MATPLNVNGKIVKRPGVYAFIKSGIQNAPLNLSYGNVVIIDDGAGDGWIGGSGVNGTIKQGKESIYSFKDMGAAQDFVKGGALWNICQPLFRPLINNTGVRINGASKVTFISAATTTPATMAYALTNGSFTIGTKDEGTGANGVLATGNLSKGYGATLTESTKRAGYYILRIYHGTYRGLDSLNNKPYNNVSNANAKPALVVESPEVRSISELVTWMQTDKVFNQGFTLVTSAIATTTSTTTTSTTSTTTTTIAIPPGKIVTADITNNAGYKLATGGTATYGAQDFEDALTAVKDQDNTFFLCLQFGDAEPPANDGAMGDNNTKIFEFITSGESRFQKMMVVAAGYDKPDFKTTSTDVAHYYDSDYVIVVHGGAKKTSSTALGGFKLFNQLHKAANALGRLAGLPPQVPLTFKALDYDAEVHVMIDDELDYALENGIMVSYYDTDFSKVVVLQDINSLQNNENIINEDNTSFSVQVKRIEFQMNRELIVNGKIRFFGNQTAGANRNTVTKEDVGTFTETFLKDRTADANKDDLIIAYDPESIVTAYQDDNVITNYRFAPNLEVNKILFIGTSYIA